MARRRIQSYETDALTVTFDPNLCIHSARCLQRQPEVFDVSRRDWIRPAAASASDVAEAVRLCPSGALQYQLVDGLAEEGDDPATVSPVRNGPDYVRGNITIRDAEGAILAQGTRFALCRCGASENKPFCDNSHRAIAFQAP